MKNLSLFSVILLFLLIFPFIHAELTGEAITGESVTGEAVTGKATTHGLSMGIYVLGVPSLAIISPENQTYFSNDSFLLNYSVSGQDEIWYNLDGEANISLSSPGYISLEEGFHTLYLYANNSQGLSSETVSFTIDLSIFEIIYSNFKNKGNTTNLTQCFYEEIQNLSGIILEDDGYGKIEFLEPINLTADSNVGDNRLNLDLNVLISSNRIEIKSNNLPNFNKKATLSLYNLSFSNPRVLKDGAVCFDCEIENYSGGTLRFNVTEFSVYSAEETPTSQPSSGGGEGGSIFDSLSEKDILINPEEIIFSLVQGETEKKEVIIQNNFERELDFSVELNNLSSFVKISEQEFSLKPGEKKIISLDFFARDDTAPDLYIGNIPFKSHDIDKKILVALEVKQKESLFDLSISLPQRFAVSYPGEEIFFYVKLINLGALEREDVTLETFVKDSDGKVVFFDEESFAVETQADHVKEMTLPANLAEGKYFISVKVIYSGGIAVASKDFLVKSKESVKQSRWILISILIALVLIIILLIIHLLFYRKAPVKRKLKKK